MLKFRGVYKIVLSNNMSNALNAVMTFTSIVLGFVGLLLTTIVGIKRESKIIKYFFDNADKKDFTSVVKKEVCSGLGTAVCTIALYFPKEFCSLFGGEIVAALFYFWITLLLYFLFSTYRLMSLLLNMLFSSEEGKPGIGKTLPEEARNKMQLENICSVEPNKKHDDHG